MHVYRLRNEEGDWITNCEEINKIVVHAFMSQLNREHVIEGDSLLEDIPQFITVEQNDLLSAFPTLEEIHDVIKNMNADSAACPNSFNGFFTQQIGRLLNLITLMLSQNFLQVKNYLKLGQMLICFLSPRLTTRQALSSYDLLACATSATRSFQNC